MIPLQAYLSSDHVSPATGKTIAITLSQNGGGYANPSGGATNATEIGSGSYYVNLSATDTGTLGPLFVQGTSSGVDNVIAIYDVVNANNGGLAYLDAAISTRTKPADTQAAVTTVTTTTNLTNAPTSGDFTATMKTSLNAATPASVGSVTGSVASVLTGGLVDLTTTTYPESSVPVGATATLKDMLVWLKTLARNKITQTSTTETLYADNGSTPVSTSTDSDDGTTFTRGKWS